MVVESVALIQRTVIVVLLVAPDIVVAATGLKVFGIYGCIGVDHVLSVWCGGGYHIAALNPHYDNTWGQIYLFHGCFTFNVVFLPAAQRKCPSINANYS